MERLGAACWLAGFLAVFIGISTVELSDFELGIAIAAAGSLFLIITAILGKLYQERCSAPEPKWQKQKRKKLGLKA